MRSPVTTLASPLPMHMLSCSYAYMLAALKPEGLQGIKGQGHEKASTPTCVTLERGLFKLVSFLKGTINQLRSVLYVAVAKSEHRQS